MRNDRPRYSLGLDFGTNSVRALIVDVSNGRELATSIWDYAHGQSGVVLDDREPHLARQHPQDYLDGIEATVGQAIAEARQDSDFRADRIVGIGVDTTGSTPLPVDDSGTPLALHPRFQENPAAMAWLWKDHSAHAEAEEITEKARASRPHYLAKCGEKYSSEWFWSKILHCRRVAPEVFEAAHTWVEISDWIPATLTDCRPQQLRRGICAAGHKAMFHPDWHGYPDQEFLASLDQQLARLRPTLPAQAYTVADPAGTLNSQWADRLRLTEGIPVAVGAFDAHLGAVGSGISPGILVKIIGTSTSDMMVWPVGTGTTGHPGPLRHRARIGAAGLLRLGSRAIGGGRHLQLVRLLHPTGRQLPPIPDPKRSRPETRGKRIAGTGLAQRQPYRADRPETHGRLDRNHAADHAG